MVECLQLYPFCSRCLSFVYSQVITTSPVDTRTVTLSYQVCLVLTTCSDKLTGNLTWPQTTNWHVWRLHFALLMLIRVKWGSNMNLHLRLWIYSWSPLTVVLQFHGPSFLCWVSPDVLNCRRLPLLTDTRLSYLSCTQVQNQLYSHFMSILYLYLGQQRELGNMSPVLLTCQLLYPAHCNFLCDKLWCFISATTSEFVPQASTWACHLKK